MPTEPDLTLRRAEPEDAEAIADFYTQARVAALPSMPPALHTNEEDRAFFAGQLAKPSHEAWLAERDGELLGYALIDPVWLDHLFIRADVTGSGVGTVLLDLVKALRPDGFSLWVFESNTGARRFYARHGFVELERTDGRANEEKSPDIRMAWPGKEPLAFYRRLVDEVDDQLAELLARRVALTRAIQPHKQVPGRDPEREAQIVARMAQRAPELGEERLARVLQAIISESLDAVSGQNAEITK
jgi:chorismate mutase/ribosomal protein S18 acetylase RimI-like enzyme